MPFINVQAQHDHENRRNERASSERVEAQKIAFFTNKLDLTPEEAQVFWPVYNEYAKAKKQLKNESVRHLEMDELDDAQANEFIKKYLDNKQRSITLDTEYIEKFKKVLPSKKVLQLIVLERKFKEEVLKDLQKRLHKRHEK